MEKARLSTYQTMKRLCLPAMIVLVMLIALAAKGQEPPLIAVGNESGVPQVLKFSELKSIMMGEKQRWKNGDRIVIALMKTNTVVGKATSSRVYDMTGDELNKFWLGQVFQGKAQAPAFFNSISELETFVAQNAGAIGIVDRAQADVDIKPIMIDGKKVF
jgi:hypothetical protein